MWGFALSKPMMIFRNGGQFYHVEGRSYNNCEQNRFRQKNHAVYPGPNSAIIHSELTLGGGMVMLTSAEDNEYNRRFMKQPDKIGGAETLTVNLVVNDADAVYEKVRAYGGEIPLDIEDKHYGGRGFTCRDLEGHIWNVGTYDPWQPK